MRKLRNLDDYLELDSFISLDEETLQGMIKSSGYYNQKAIRLLQLSRNIKNRLLA